MPACPDKELCTPVDTAPATKSIWQDRKHTKEYNKLCSRTRPAAQANASSPWLWEGRSAWPASVRMRRSPGGSGDSPRASPAVPPPPCSCCCHASGPPPTTRCCWSASPGAGPGWRPELRRATACLAAKSKLAPLLRCDAWLAGGSSVLAGSTGGSSPAVRQGRQGGRRHTLAEATARSSCTCSLSRLAPQAGTSPPSLHRHRASATQPPPPRPHLRRAATPPATRLPARPPRACWAALGCTRPCCTAGGRTRARGGWQAQLRSAGPAGAAAGAGRLASAAGRAGCRACGRRAQRCASWLACG